LFFGQHLTVFFALREHVEVITVTAILNKDETGIAV
jgi:hypothetical protein